MNTTREARILALYKAHRVLSRIDPALRSSFPGVPFRLKFQGEKECGPAIAATVYWTGGPTEESVRQAVSGIDPEKPDSPDEPPVRVEFARTEAPEARQAGGAGNVIPFRPRGGKRP